MNIAKALKVKSRLIGEIVGLRNTLRSVNSRRDDQVYAADPADVDNQLNVKEKELLKLKVAIAKATAPGIDMLVEMGELKSRLLFLAQLSSYAEEGVEQKLLPNDTLKEVVITAYYTGKKLIEMKKSLQDQINDLQDAIDDFNASTTVSM